MDKHSSLFRKFVNYGRKMFYSTGPWIPPWAHQQFIDFIPVVVAAAVCVFATTRSTCKRSLIQVNPSSFQDQLMQLSPTEADDVEIRNEISQLKQRLAGTDQELQRTNLTLR